MLLCRKLNAVALCLGMILATATPQAQAAKESPQPVTLQDPPAQQSTEKLNENTSRTFQILLQKTETLPIDLPTVIALVEDQNLFLQREKEGARIALSRYRLSQAALLPNIEGDYNQNRFQGAVQIFGDQTLTILRSTVQPQIGASWTLYPGGRNIFEMLAARRRTKASEIQVTETYQEQMSRAVEEFYRFLEAQVERDLLLISIQEVEKQVEMNRAKVEVGTGTKLDLMRSETLLARRERELIEAEKNMRTAEQALLNRLNLDVNLGLLTPEGEAIQRRLIPPSTQAKELVKQALENHPALKKISEELAALGIDLKAIRSDFLPSVTVNTFLNGTGPRFADLQLSRYGGLVINMNFLDNLGFNVPLRMREKKAEIAQKVVERQMMIRDIETRVVDAFLNSESYASEIQASVKERTVAEEAYRLALGRYESGVGINLDVIDSEVALNAARVSVARAVLNFNRAQVQLLEATGHISPETLLNGVIEP